MPVRVVLGDAERWYPAGATTAYLVDPDLEVEVAAVIHADISGVRCSEVRFSAVAGSVGIDRRPPTAAQVRRIVAEALVQTAYFIDGGRGFPTIAELTAFETETLRATRPRRRDARTPERYREVARLYRQAVDKRVPPRPHIKAGLNLGSLNTARNLITEARHRVDPDTGRPYLEPADQG